MRSWCLPLYLWSLPPASLAGLRANEEGLEEFMSVGSFAADPAFPQLAIATDPALMKQTFRPTRLVGAKVYDIQDCRFIRLRYRQDSRCFLLYTLRLVEPDTGARARRADNRALYAQKDKAEQTWRKLKATDPGSERSPLAG